LTLLAVYNGSVSTQQILDSGDNDEATISAALQRLSERGLLRAGSRGRTPAWTMPNTVRTYVQTRLTPPVVLVERRNAHAEHHLHLVRNLAVDLAGEHEERAVAEWGKVADQLPAAHAWFVERGQARQSAALSLASWEYSFLRQHYGAYGWLDDTLTIDGIDQIDDYPDLLAQGALAAWAQDRFLRAEHLAAEAGAEARRRGEPTPIAAYKARFNVAAHQDQGAEAARLLGRLLAVSEERGDVRHHSDNLVVAALGYGQAGLKSEAAVAARRANELAVSLGNPTSVSWARVALASVDVVDDPDRAAQSFASAARLARTVANRWVNGMATTGLVTVLRRQGRLDHARRLLAEVADLWVRARQQGQISRVCQEAVLLLGAATATDDDRNRAAILLEQFALEGHRLQLLPDDQDRFSESATTLVVRDRSALGDAPLGRLVIEALRG
jgi:hypothetical protein